MGTVTVLRAGPLTSVQDLGRTGHRALGVARGGALDPFAAQVANILVGNPATAALLEVTLGGLRLRFATAGQIAWAGCDCPVRIAERFLPAGRVALVRPDDELEMGMTRNGCRAWLALAGGIEVPSVLGSRSTDLRAGFGGPAGRALRDGDELSLGAMTSSRGEAPSVSTWGAPPAWVQTAVPPRILRAVRGAEWTEFSAATRATFFETAFTVGPQTDRMGARLTGPELQRRRPRELISEGVAPGTLQVANDGQPILLLGDCQTIGGYPKIAHVITVDLGRAAQFQPNDIVRFQEVSLPEASALYAARERELERFRVGVDLHRR